MKNIDLILYKNIKTCIRIIIHNNTRVLWLPHHAVPSNKQKCQRGKWGSLLTSQDTSSVWVKGRESPPGPIQ